MARDATARLYDVDEDKLKFTRLTHTGRYDQGTITFQARKNKLISLDKLHESVWATRLSGGTKSGVICLQVNVIGRVVEKGDALILQVRGAKREFVLVKNVRAKPRGAKPSALKSLRNSRIRANKTLRVTGYVEGWTGRWPNVLKKRPAKQPRLMVISFKAASPQNSVAKISREDEER